MHAAEDGRADERPRETDEDRTERQARFGAFDHADLLMTEEPHEQLRADAEEKNAEGELFVEARAERHDDAREATFVLDVSGEEIPDDVRASHPHEERVKHALTGDL